MREETSSWFKLRDWSKPLEPATDIAAAIRNRIEYALGFPEYGSR